jgi:hypothetical protein
MVANAYKSQLLSRQRQEDQGSLSAETNAQDLICKIRKQKAEGLEMWAKAVEHLPSKHKALS